MRSFVIAVGVAMLAFNQKVLFRKEFAVPPTDGGVILISGTSSGIGRATCGFMAKQFPRVILYCGVRKETDAVGYPFDSFPNVKSVILDITNQEDVDGVLAEIQSSEQPLIGLVNNAGVADLAIFEFTGVEKLRSIFEVNVMGTYRLTQAALPMIRQAKGRIVIVSSVSALTPGYPLWSAYMASKYALEAMGNALRIEMAPLGVSVSLVEPGYLKSGMIDGNADIVKSYLDSTKPDERQIYPHLVDGKYPREINEISRATGLMEETCEAITDAVFGKYPETRYITSRIGPFPSWLAVRIFSVLPDRLGDWTADHLDILLGIMRFRTAVEQFLGIS